MDWLIYTLKNPRTLEVRYVGWTSLSADQRLRTHIAESVVSQKTHKQRWILSLLSIGLTPVIEVIESGTGDGWSEAERRWIAFFRASGARLVNGTDGGDGVVGWLSPEQRIERRKKISTTWASKTPEERNAIGVKRWASKTPEERDALAKKISDGRFSMTPAQRGAAGKKRWSDKSPEQRSDEAKRRWAKTILTPQQRARRSEVRRQMWANMTPAEREAMAEKMRKPKARRSPKQG